MQRKLTVTAAFYLQFGNNVDGSGTQHLIFPVSQRHSRSDNDAVTGVYANRVKVFHGADGDNIALAVTDNFELNFFPAADALFDQNLCDRRQTQTVLGDVTQHFFVIGNTAAGAAQRECRTHDNRIADGLCEIYSVFDVSTTLDGMHGC